MKSVVFSAIFFILIINVQTNTINYEHKQYKSQNKEIPKTVSNKRPNILFCIADDWGWPHAGAYGDAVVKTPTFDRLASQGVLFENAFVSSPSCTPSRNAILTGQFHWRLQEGANLWSTLDVIYPVYPLLLENEGYHVGYWRKSFGPGNIKAGGYTNSHPAGAHYKNGFKAFMDAKPKDQPFCFWLGASDPHRSYKKGSGAQSGIDIDAIEVPKFYPDVAEIRNDIADYYYEVQRFDSDCAKAIKILEESGELDNTIIVITGDHGMPFPRCKSNLYDMGVRVPLVISWGKNIKPNRRIKDFVSLTDLAPTFLEAAGVEIPTQITGNSLLPILKSKKNKKVDKTRDYMIFGKERHTPAQNAPSTGGYPSRAIRTKDYLYIYNFDANRWPAGAPNNATHPMGSFSDCDNGPTKSFIIENKDNTKYKTYFDLSFSKRPTEELYKISKDPYQLNNLSADSDFIKIKNKLHKELIEKLKATKDPRVIGGGELFDDYPYRAPYKLNLDK